jgi:hypothetical protein
MICSECEVFIADYRQRVDDLADLSSLIARHAGSTSTGFIRLKRDFEESKLQCDAVLAAFNVHREGHAERKK